MQGSDVGGGASILGVLSGTDGNPISIGENTLLGANSTCGIPLGDACIIDGGLATFCRNKTGNYRRRTWLRLLQQTQVRI